MEQSKHFYFKLEERGHRKVGWNQSKNKSQEDKHIQQYTMSGSLGIQKWDVSHRSCGQHYPYGFLDVANMASFVVLLMSYGFPQQLFDFLRSLIYFLVLSSVSCMAFSGIACRSLLTLWYTAYPPKPSFEM